MVEIVKESFNLIGYENLYNIIDKRSIHVLLRFCWSILSNTLTKFWPNFHHFLKENVFLTYLLREVFNFYLPYTCKHHNGQTMS